MEDYQEIEKQIDQQIGDLNELKRLARNPGMLAFIRQMLAVSQPTNAVAACEANRTEPNRGFEVSTMLTIDAATQHHKATETYYRELSDAVEFAIQKFERESFAIRDVADLMIKTGYVFRAKDPRVAINGVLSKLVGKKVEIVEPGAGKRPTIFRNFADNRQASLVVEKHA